MLLVYLFDPQPGQEEELREALRGIPAEVRVQEAGTRWLLRIDAAERKPVREAIQGLLRRFPGLGVVHPLG